MKRKTLKLDSESYDYGFVFLDEMGVEFVQGDFDERGHQVNLSLAEVNRLRIWLNRNKKRFMPSRRRGTPA